MKKRVVEWLATVFGRFHEYAEVLHYLLLTAEVVEGEWSESVLKVFLALSGSIALLPDVEVVILHSFSFSR